MQATMSEAELEDDIFYTALWRARQTVDDYGNIVRIYANEYDQAVDYYCQQNV